jgi:hypothetical protein
MSALPFSRQAPNHHGFYAFGNGSIADTIVSGVSNESEPQTYKAETQESKFCGLTVTSRNRLSVIEGMWTFKWAFEEFGAVALDAARQPIGYAEGELHQLEPCDAGKYLEVCSERGTYELDMGNAISSQCIYEWSAIRQLVIINKCEVRAEGRGHNLGKALVDEVIRRAAKGGQPVHVLMKPFPLDWRMDHAASLPNTTIVDAPVEFFAARDRLLRFWRESFPFLQSFVFSHTNEPFLIGIVPQQYHRW